MDRIFVLHGRTTNRTPAPAPSAWAGKFPALTPLPASRRGRGLPCGARPTAARTRPSSTCSPRSATVDKIPDFIAKVKDKLSATKLMGFGHRVYKNFDPRAKIMRDSCHEVLKDLGVKDPMLDVAMELERIALSDPYFIDRKLYPNVDFYSGIILRAIGIPHRDVSPASSPWPAPSAGSPNGTK